MPIATIQNGSNVPLNFQQGTIPNMGEALTDYFQPMTFTLIGKSVSGFQAVETQTPVTFFGILMPLSPRELLLLPEGQRAWTVYRLYAQPVLTLQVDDIIILSSINNKQTRVMSREDFALYSYVTYTLTQDWVAT